MSNFFLKGVDYQILINIFQMQTLFAFYCRIFEDKKIENFCTDRNQLYLKKYNSRFLVNQCVSRKRSKVAILYGPTSNSELGLQKSRKYKIILILLLFLKII